MRRSRELDLAAESGRRSWRCADRRSRRSRARRPAPARHAGRRARSSVRPSMSASGLPGNRVEANRAGMTATTSSGRLVSTAKPVDAGCTANNSTGRWAGVLRSPAELDELHAHGNLRARSRRHRGPDCRRDDGRPPARWHARQSNARALLNSRALNWLPRSRGCRNGCVRRPSRPHRATCSGSTRPCAGPWTRRPSFPTRCRRRRL